MKALALAKHQIHRNIMKHLTLLSLCCVTSSVFSQNYSWDGKTLLLDNGFISRHIVYNKDRLTFTTHQLFLKEFDKGFINKESPDFSLLANDRKMDGFSAWTLITCESARDDNQGRGATVKLKNKDALEVNITYLLYPELPLIKKCVKLINHGAADLKIEALNIEDLCATDWGSMFGKTDLVIYNNYGRMKHIGRYVGDWDDALVVFHNTTLRAGMALGNETPGVLKRVAYQVDGSASIQAGTTHPGQDFPFRKWLKPGEAWESPATFMALYDHSDNGTEVINGTVNTYVRKYMGTRLAQITSKPGFVYNTWNPFRTFLTDALIRDVAKAAAECGIQEFVIDDGWQVNASGKTSSKMVGENYGDWLVDRKKFPDDLKATFDYIRSLGMKPGLWISIGTATSDSKVFKEHPEWFVKNIKGEPGNLHTLSSSHLRTACLGTDWFAYIKGVILSLVKEHGLAYAKLDLSILTSAYVDDIRISGCYAKDHPAHRDHEESFIAIYERVMQLFDELHKEAPGLFIDCTFETVGKLQSIDYAFCKHAEGNWLSNFEQPYPTGALRVRQMAWWRSPAMPASALVVGNQTMDGEKFIYTLKSLMGTLPIVLGDPRKLSTAQRAEIKGWSDWMLAMQKKYNYMAFRQDLPGFGEPQEGAWDGWQRLNTESKGGGIVGVFKQGAREASRTVFVSGLDPAAEYVVHMAPCNKEVVRCSGQQLMEVGFVVTIPGLYDGNIYAVEKCN